MTPRPSSSVPAAPATEAAALAAKVQEALRWSSARCITGTDDYARQKDAIAALDALVSLVAATEQQRDEAQAQKRGLEIRIEQQRLRLSELDAIVADHANHYRVPITKAAEAARRHIEAWQEQYWRAEAAERRAAETEAALQACVDYMDDPFVFWPHNKGSTRCVAVARARVALSAGGPERTTT